MKLISYTTQVQRVTEEQAEREGLYLKRSVVNESWQKDGKLNFAWHRLDDQKRVAGPFETPEEAWEAWPEVQRENVRHREALAQAVLEKQRAEKQEKLDREESTRRSIEEERIARARIPEKYRALSLEKITAKTESLAEALEAAKSYVSLYPPLRDNNAMVLCGPAGRGKTSIGCAIAHDLAIAGHIVRYVTLPELIEADLSAAHGDTGPMAELQATSLLILDGIGIPASKDAGVRCISEIVSAVTAVAVRSLLDARLPKGETWEPHYRLGSPTLLIADFPDLAGLSKYLGDSAFDRLKKHSVRMLEIL